jgi:hypothetical protein
VRKLICLLPLCALLTGGLVACAKQNQDTRKANRTAVGEAYTLMDHGDNGRAVILLEGVVEQEPANAEARLMLASAYMGKAGIDVLVLHDSFQDVLFSRSLSEVFSSDTNAGEAPKASAPKNGLLPGEEETRVEKLLRQLDALLDTTRRVMIIFNRFPQIPERNWPYLDQALFHLDQLGDIKEVRVYRLFIRMLYLKEYLVRKIIHDSSFGTRAWACRLEASELQDGLLWAMSLLANASQDFIQIYPKEGSPFVRAYALFRGIEDGLTHLQDEVPVGGESAMSMGQRRLREALRCGS